MEEGCGGIATGMPGGFDCQLILKTRNADSQDAIGGEADAS